MVPPPSDAEFIAEPRQAAPGDTLTLRVTSCGSGDWVALFLAQWDGLYIGQFLGAGTAGANGNFEISYTIPSSVGPALVQFQAFAIGPQGPLQAPLQAAAIIWGGSGRRDRNQRVLDWVANVNRTQANEGETIRVSAPPTAGPEPWGATEPEDFCALVQRTDGTIVSLARVSGVSGEVLDVDMGAAVEDGVHGWLTMVDGISISPDISDTANFHIEDERLWCLSPDSTTRTSNRQVLNTSPEPDPTCPLYPQTSHRYVQTIVDPSGSIILPIPPDNWPPGTTFDVTLHLWQGSESIDLCLRARSFTQVASTDLALQAAVSLNSLALGFPITFFVVNDDFHVLWNEESIDAGVFVVRVQCN
jgi:hypothetical protein